MRATPGRAAGASGRAETLSRAAARIFARDGYHGATIAVIAQAAGVATGTFYLYFPSKEGCFLRLIERFYSSLLAQVVLDRQSAFGALEKLAASVQAVLLAFEADPCISTMILLRTGGSTAEIEHAMARITDELWHLLTRDLEEAETSGLIAPGDAGLRARLVMGSISEALLESLREQPLGARGRQEVVRFVMGGLASSTPWDRAAHSEK